MTKETQDAQVMVMVPAQEWFEKTEKINQIFDLVKTFADKQSEWLTPKEVCEFLKIGIATVYRLRNNGTIKFHQIAGSKRWYAKKSEVLQMLHEGKF
jgi:excisionase family DNA binding protein